MKQKNKNIRGKKTEVYCKACNTLFEARIADVNRGWGQHCSKVCASITREKIIKITNKLLG